MGNINEDFIFGEEMRDKAVEIIKKEMPEIIDIKFSKAGGSADREFGIDARVEFDYGFENWAFKLRRAGIKEKYGSDVTVEYKNAKDTQYENKGDWFKFKTGCVQKYVYGWQNGELHFLIIDLSKCIWDENEWNGPIKNYYPNFSNFYSVSLEQLRSWKAIIKEMK